MLYDTTEHLLEYSSLSPRLERAFRFLAETDFSSLPDGHIELDGKDVFADLSTYETRLVNDTPEAHRKYIDVQYLLHGKELVGVAPLSAMQEELSGDEARDIWFYRGPTERLTLSGSRVLVLWPQDAHAPCVAVGAPETVRKCVIKVRKD